MSKKRLGETKMAWKSQEHPLGIQPWGTAYLKGLGEEKEDYMETSRRNRTMSLGTLAQLEDSIIFRVLKHVTVGRDLAIFGQASKYCYAFSRQPDLWRALTVSKTKGYVGSFMGSWYETYKNECRTIPSRI